MCNASQGGGIQHFAAGLRFEVKAFGLEVCIWLIQNSGYPKRGI